MGCRTRDLTAGCVIYLGATVGIAVHIDRGVLNGLLRSAKEKPGWAGLFLNLAGPPPSNQWQFSHIFSTEAINYENLSDTYI